MQNKKPSVGGGGGGRIFLELHIIALVLITVVTIKILQ